jgi:hypothetical protein
VNALDPTHWLAVLRDEYLAEFVSAGGAAVKFAVPGTELPREILWAGLRDAAERLGYQFVLVDAATTKIHLIERVFHELARQVDWDALSYAFLTDLLTRWLAEQGQPLPEPPYELKLSVIAERLDDEEPRVRAEVERRIWRAINRDYAMSQEFRLAMIQLVLARLDPSNDPPLTEAVHQWLRGELQRTSALKKAQIFQKIARHNARHMLFSLAHWLTLAGRSGLVLGLDITRYASPARYAAQAGGNSYTAPAVLDMYEVLRQLIDATDELEHCLVVVLTAPEFLTDETRGLARYDALRLRIGDEVRDRNRANPLAALARLVASPAREG